MNKNSVVREYTNIKTVQKLYKDYNLNSVFVVDERGILIGLCTKGDMSHYLNNNKFDESTPISEVMNKNPIAFFSKREAIDYSQNVKRLAVYPIVDSHRVLVDVLYNTWDIIAASDSNCMKDVPLVIMAGGKGTRLYPLTKILPKALVPIGDYSITERIINNFRVWGCREVYLILNHKAEMIKAYFQDLEKDYKVHYIMEKEFFGTGGGLSLLKGIINKTFILSNCDVLVNTDINELLSRHNKDGDIITVVAAEKNYTIPYGVINTTEDNRINKLSEKPKHSFLTNTGIYVIESEVIDSLKNNNYYDMTDIISDYMSSGKRVGAFPIGEKSWLDMGQFKELDEMISALGIEE